MTAKSSDFTEVLIVEDSLTQAEQLKYILEQQGYRTRHARNGAQGLEQLRERKPTLVISDINMPEMDGYELCRRIRADAELADLPVILLTALADPEDVLLGLECGADNFVTKPHDEAYLISRIRSITANRHLRSREDMRISLEIHVGGRKHQIAADRLQILNLLLSTYESAVLRNKQLLQAQDELRRLNETLEERVRERTAELSAEIAERVRADADRTRLLHERQSLLESTSEGIAGVDAGGRCTFINRTGAELLGYNPEKLLGAILHDVVQHHHPDGTPYPASESPINRAYTKGEACRIETELFSRADGSRFPVEYAACPIREGEGITGAVITFRDVTEEKKMEAELLRIQRLDTIGALAGGVAHDLNNILSPILMGLELLETMGPTQAARRLIGSMRTSAVRGRAVVKQILSFARGSEPELGAIPLDRLILDQAEVCWNTFPKNINIEKRVSAGLWTVIGDRTAIFQVLMNLCVNARDAMPDGGTLTLEAENITVDEHWARTAPGAKPGRYAMLRVADTGTGIPPEIVDRICEPFFTTKQPGAGTGLGLSTTSHIVRSHGGFMTIRSEPGHGAEFSIYLPSSTPDTAREAPSVAPPVPAGHGELILVADDEKTLLEMMKSMLELNGYRVLAAKDGPEAVLLMARHHAEVAVAVMDADMPLMNGASTIRVLQQMQPGLSALLISGREEARHAKELAGLERVRVLQKPFDAEALLTEVGTLLSAVTVTQSDTS